MPEPKTRSAKAAEDDAPEVEAQAADSGPDEPMFTPQQAIDSSRELADGQPGWLVSEALTKAGLIDAGLLTQDQITQAITGHLDTPVPDEPVPGAGADS